MTPVRTLLPAALALVLALAACDQSMIDQPKYEEYEPAALFPDGLVMQKPVEGTIARDELAYRRALENRPPLTRALLERGQERYTIYCLPCHGAAGHGDGMIPRRGFPNPPSYHIPRLRQAPPRYVVQVITEGKGDMFSYAARVAPADRWAIAAYVKALQLSQQVAAERVPDHISPGLVAIADPEQAGEGGP